MKILLKLQNFVVVPQTSLGTYVLAMFLIAAIPSLAISYLAILIGRSVLGLTSGPAAQITDGYHGSDLLWAVVFGPFVETLILGFVLQVLGIFLGRKWLAALVSALVWGFFHAAIVPLWFFAAAWSFFIYSCSFLAWRSHSLTHGVLAAALPHALVNLLSYFLGG